MAWRDDVLDTVAILSDEIEASGRVDLSSKLDIALGMLGGVNFSLATVSFGEISKFFTELHTERLEASANQEAFDWILKADLQSQAGYLHTVIDDLMANVSKDNVVDNLAKLQALAVVLGKQQ